MHYPNVENTLSGFNVKSGANLKDLSKISLRLATLVDLATSVQANICFERNVVNVEGFFLH